MHSKDFHDNIDILDGFEFYDRNVDCRLANCPSNKVNRHFHCTRPNCNYSFVQYSTMAMHNQKHQEETFAEIKIKNEPADEKIDGEQQLQQQQQQQQQQQFRAMNLTQQTQENKISGECFSFRRLNS